MAYFNGFGTDPVIGSPTRAQVTGTWVGDQGARLVLRPPGGCPGYASSFDLQAETASPSGSGGPALFYYTGDPDDWAGQYAFTRQ